MLRNPSRVQILHHLGQGLNAFILQDNSFSTSFLSAFPIHIVSLPLLDHFFCFFYSFTLHWTSRLLLVWTTLYLFLMLFPIGVYYGQKEGRWSLSLMTVIHLDSCSNRWREVRPRLSWWYAHTLYNYGYLKKMTNTANPTKALLLLNLSCFISQR